MCSVMKVFKKDGSISWRSQVRVRGFPEKSQNFSTENEARTWGDQLQKAYKASKNNQIIESVVGTSKTMKNAHFFDDIMDLYIKEHLPTIKDGNRRISQLNFWKLKFQTFTLDEISTDLIQKIVDDLSKTETKRNKAAISMNTVQRYVAALSHFFTIAYKEWKYCSSHPVIGVIVGGINRSGRTGVTPHYNKWTISKNLLPEPELLVLAFFENGTYDIGTCYPPNTDDINELRWKNMSGQSFETNATHWIKLPSPPNQ